MSETTDMDPGPTSAKQTFLCGVCEGNMSECSAKVTSANNAHLLPIFNTEEPYNPYIDLDLSIPIDKFCTNLT